VSWYSTTSLAQAKVQSVPAPWHLPCWDIAGPCSLSVWGSIHYSFKVEQLVVYLSSPSALGAVRFTSFVLGGPPKGLCLSLVSFLLLSFLTCLEKVLLRLAFVLGDMTGDDGLWFGGV